MKPQYIMQQSFISSGITSAVQACIVRAPANPISAPDALPFATPFSTDTVMSILHVQCLFCANNNETH